MAGIKQVQLVTLEEIIIFDEFASVLALIILSLSLLNLALLQSLHFYDRPSMFTLQADLSPLLFGMPKEQAKRSLTLVSAAPGGGQVMVEIAEDSLVREPSQQLQ